MRGHLLSENLKERINNRNQKDPVLAYVSNGPIDEFSQRIEQLQLVGVDIKLMMPMTFDPGVIKVLKEGAVHSIILKKEEIKCPSSTQE